MGDHMADAYKAAMAKAAQDYADAVAKAAELDEASVDAGPVPEAKPSGPEQDRPEFNAAAFFDVIRAGLFGGSLSQGQVDGHNIIGNVCSVAGLDPVLEQSAYILATVYHETARTMQPIEEYGGWNTRYAPWFGRGYVQLTWEENDKRQQDKLHAIEQVHIYRIPYLPGARRLESCARTQYIGPHHGRWHEGWRLHGKERLSDYIKPGSVDYVNARRIVNGTDRAEQIAGYAREYERALRAGMDG
jgi:putative chitinase